MICSVQFQITLGCLDIESKIFPMLLHLFPNFLLCLAQNFFFLFGKHCFDLLFYFFKLFFILDLLICEEIETVARFLTVFDDLLRAISVYVLLIVVRDERFYYILRI